MRWLAIPLIFALLATAVIAQNFPNPVDKYVNDFAGILDVSQKVELRTLLQNVDETTTAEITVVTVNTTAPDVPSQYRTELFNRWGIGKKDNDNGLLILYAKEEHRIEVEVGYGLEGILPDSKVGHILDEQYVPMRDAGNVSIGIVQATRALAQVVLDNAEEVRSGQASTNVPDMLIWLIMMFVFIIIPILAVVAQRLITPKCPYGHRTKFDRIEGNYIIYKCKYGHEVRKLMRRSPAFLFVGGFGGGGGGFGGGGFGGGGSGGGGAGR